jgi:hypothetical protein
MKTIFIADNHGRSCRALVEREMENGVRKLVSLGDYGTPKVLREILALPIEKKIIIGNHEYHHCIGEFIGQDGYRDLWNNDKEMKNFILQNSIVDRKNNAGFILEDRLAGRDVVYAHASIESGVNAWGYRHLWDFFEGEKHGEELSRNFKIMEEKDFWLFFRGHEHYPCVWSFKNKQIKRDFSCFDAPIILSQDSKYIVTLDLYKNRRYATFDDEKRELEFKVDGF